MLALAEELRAEAESGAGREERYREALDIIGGILGHATSHFYSEPALLLRAEILLDGLHRPAEALEALRGASFRSVERSRQAERLVMRSLLIGGRWDEAEQRFGRLSSDADSVMAAIGIYGTGMMRFYRGEYQAALDSLSRFAEHHPWSEYANDALETAILVKEALVEGERPLDCYRAARVLLERGMPGPAADTLDAFRGRYPVSVLAPRVLFVRAEVDLGAGDIPGASALLETITEEFPLHELAPRALERLAELALAVGPAEAAELYGTIIERYPDDPFIGRIRSRYIELRKSAEGASNGG
jgi:outer membrane protein assembly factor BamD (BamD/ComL family)